MVERMNAWGATRDQELLDLRSNLVATQVVVSTTFDQAKATLLAIVVDFRAEAEMMRQHGQYEAAQSVARFELVVTEARTRFDAQDERFADGLRELVRRQQAVEAWVQAEPTRVAAIVQAAPAPPWVQTSPGGTPLTFYPSPGLGLPTPGLVLPVPTTPPPRTAQPAATPAWDAWAAGRATQNPAAEAPMPDAWAASRAAATAQESPGVQRHFDMSTPGGGAGRGAYPREMRIDARGWGDHRKLDVGTSCDGFQIWKDRALGFLTRERPDIRKLLMWAETQSKDGLEVELTAHAARLGVADLPTVEYAIHDGIKLTILDSLLGRARNCIERGCELWRSLCAEWSGAAPQLKQAKARQFMELRRCKDISELWSRLPAWERTGEEVLLTGLELPEWMRNSAIEALLPQQLLNTMIARSDLDTSALRLAWVKTQMEYARGAAQATAYNPSTGKDASGDVYMNSVEAPDATRRGRVVEAVVDSGAVHSVAPPSCFPGPMTSSPWSRAGRGYRAANGTGIKNLGQVQVKFSTGEGHQGQIPFQVAEVEQPLLSVAHLTAAGNKVELGASGGRITNLSTGRTMALEKRGGLYLLKMFIADGGPPLPFRRQGA